MDDEIAIDCYAHQSFFEIGTTLAVRLILRTVDLIFKHRNAGALDNVIGPTYAKTPEFELISDVVRSSALAPHPTLSSRHCYSFRFSPSKGARWPLNTSYFIMPEATPVIDRSFRAEQERLLGHDIEFEDMTGRTLDNKSPAYMDNEYREDRDGGQVSGVDGAPDNGEDGQTPPVYRVYKRRWFGLMQLVLMNIIVSWDVSLGCSISVNCIMIDD